MSRLASTLLPAALLVTVSVLVRAPAHTQHAAPVADVFSAQQPATQWSAPATLGSCPASGAARVLFPSNKPDRATGPGAVVWNASAACPGGEGARVATIGAADQPGAARIPRTSGGEVLAPRGPLAATGGPHGQIVIAGSATEAPRHGQASSGLLIQGRASGPFSPLQAPGGATAPIALATAYLGDVAVVAAPTAAAAAPTAHGAHGATGTHGGLNIHVERFFSHRFLRNVSASSGSRHGAVQALTLAMDFRSEALAVWAQRGAIYARLTTNTGAEHPLQRLAAVGSKPQIAAVLSDDNRAIVAWSEQRKGQTSVYIDRSGTGVHFGAPELLESFQDPNGLSSPAGSPSLVRLSSESVTLAWAGAAAGHWVVRTAPVDLDGVQSVATVAAPGGDALFAGLAAGPDDDALLLWTEPLPTAGGRPDMERQAIFTARGTDTGPGRSRFGEPELLASPGPVSHATVAMDPASDRAVAAWQGEAGTITYSIRSPGA